MAPASVEKKYVIRMNDLHSVDYIPALSHQSVCTTHREEEAYDHH
jgi:hypothetical protein